MKLKLIPLCCILLFCAKNTNAQNNIAVKKVTAPSNVAAPVTRITGVSIINDSLVHQQGSIPYHHYIKAEINSFGSGRVNYQWVLRDSNTPAGAVSKTSTGAFTLSGNGVDFLEYATNTTNNGIKYFLTLEIKTPTQISTKEFQFQ